MNPKNPSRFTRPVGTAVCAPCPDCGVPKGSLHNDWCDVECCPDCGEQSISCGCAGEITLPRIPWSGEWPGLLECREFGWYAKLIPGKGWVACDKTDPGAHEDLNRLSRDALWSKERARFILAVAADRP